MVVWEAAVSVAAMEEVMVEEAKVVVRRRW